MEKTYLSSYPELVIEFDLTANPPNLTPERVTHKSNKKVWWRCKNNHSWEAVVASRTCGGNGCPMCAGQRAIPGENDLATGYPELALEWDDSRNDTLPNEVLPQSNKKVWWRCRLDHEWLASPAARTRGRGCPVCTGKKVLQGFNDLESQHPDLVREWDYSKNSLNPSDVTAGSGYRAWWKCLGYGHTWSTRVCMRTASTPRGCPICSRRGSKIEKALADNLPNSIHGANIPVSGFGAGSCSVDILLPNNIVVEYDGWFFHKNTADRDDRKTNSLISSGYTVIRVREQSNEQLQFLTPRDNLFQISHHIVEGDIQDTAKTVMSIISSLSDTINIDLALEGI